MHNHSNPSAGDIQSWTRTNPPRVCQRVSTKPVQTRKRFIRSTPSVNTRNACIWAGCNSLAHNSSLPLPSPIVSTRFVMTNSPFSTSDGKWTRFLWRVPPSRVSLSPSPFPHVEGPRGTEATKRYPRGGFSASANSRICACGLLERIRKLRAPFDTGAIISTCKNTIEVGRENI